LCWELSWRGGWKLWHKRRLPFGKAIGSTGSLGKAIGSSGIRGGSLRKAIRSSLGEGTRSSLGKAMGSFL
jgi:hypothetical protein